MGSRDQWEFPPFFRPQWQSFLHSANGSETKNTLISTKPILVKMIDFDVLHLNV